MNVTSLFARDNSITFPNRKVVTFDNKVWKVELLNNVVTVVIESPKSSHDNNNVISYSIDGEFIWRIAVDEKQLYPGQTYCPFVDIDTAEHYGHPEQLMLYSWCEIALRVESATGKVLDKTRTK